MSDPVAPQQTPQPTYAATVPGKTLGIVSLVLSIVVAPLSIIWLITGIVAVNQSKKAGASNVPGVIAIVLSALGIIAGVIWLIDALSLVASTVALS